MASDSAGSDRQDSHCPEIGLRKSEQLRFNMLNEYRLHKLPCEEQPSCNLGLLVDQLSLK